MKKLLITLLVITMVLPAFAQTFSLRAGLNLSNMLMKDDVETYSEENKMNPGFHLGGLVEFPLSDGFAIETGLLVSTTGFKIKESDPTFGDAVGKINIYNLNIPITAKAYVNAGSNTKIYFNFGPYIGFGLSGKSKYTFDGDTESTDIEIGSSDTDDIKAFDFGIQAGTGVEISSFVVGVSYGLGLANISNYTEDGTKINNRVLAISLGYKFGGN
jgi:hypothetical protein